MRPIGQSTFVFTVCVCVCGCACVCVCVLFFKLAYINIMRGSSRRKGPRDRRFSLQCRGVIAQPFEVMSGWGAGDVGYVAIALFYC